MKRNARIIWFNGKCNPPTTKSNYISNTKYNLFTFVPKVLIAQICQVYNLFFFGICATQLFSALRIGFLIAYLGPLIFVLSVTLIREAVDDIQRALRDREVNGELYSRLSPSGFVQVRSGDIRVGDIIKLEENRRIPADMILLHTTEKKGNIFIKTDQLDGETDWKLRKAITRTQSVQITYHLIYLNAWVSVEAPHKDIYKFQGTFYYEDRDNSQGLELENTLWTNTVVASGTALGLVIYTGSESRFKLNSREPRTKAGRIDAEINRMAIFLFVLLFGMSILMETLAQVQPWYVKIKIMS